MSVAFRRDSDEEHLEPKFARPIPPGPNLVTPRGKALIDAQLLSCEAALTAAIDEPAAAAAKRELAYWQTRQATAQIMPPADGCEVAFGTTVSFSLNGKPQTLSIVGLDEADGIAELIGFTAPLARALMGAELGDILPFGVKHDAIEILKVTPL
jgi:transcription elongation GreA/GreB family factor